MDAFIRGTEEAGCSMERMPLMKTEVKGCSGCNVCRNGKLCVQKEGFNELVPKIAEDTLEAAWKFGETYEKSLSEMWREYGISRMSAGRRAFEKDDGMIYITGDAHGEFGRIEAFCRWFGTCF